jgi:5-methyltetrahydrofolate--homocysteine methyltransferase
MPTPGYDLAPERMAADIAVLMDAGARMIGGCCGTTPAHIAATARGAGALSLPCGSPSSTGS